MEEDKRNVKDKMRKLQEEMERQKQEERDKFHIEIDILEREKSDRIEKEKNRQEEKDLERSRERKREKRRIENLKQDKVELQYKVDQLIEEKSKFSERNDMHASLGSTMKGLELEDKREFGYQFVGEIRQQEHRVESSAGETEHEVKSRFF